MKDIKVSLDVSELTLPNTNELKEYQAKQNGELTPKEFLKIIINELLQGDIQEMIIIRKNAHDQLVSGWTYNNAAEAIGALEIAKQSVIDEI